MLFIPLKGNCHPHDMEIFNNDKFARPEMKNMCSVCHENPNGGGTRNAFGMAFEANNETITNDLRKKFPELFDLMKALEPKIIRIKPSMITVSQEAKLAIIGKNFANDSIVKIDGNSENIQSTFVNPKRIDVTITFSDIGVHTVQVVNVTEQASNTFKIKVKPAK